MRSWLPLLALALTHHGRAQQDPIPGHPADASVDVTGDGIADLLITSRTIPISDPQQPGYLGQYKVGVRTLSGTSVLMWSTLSTQRWFTLDSAARLDTAELSRRIHFKQLHWTDPAVPTEFWLLERPFGPAITKDQDGWYGTGDHHDGHTLVLRSANERGTGVAAFSFELPFPYGRVEVRTKKAVRVPNGYGEEGDPAPSPPKVMNEFDFGHEANEPQVMVPPGIPPDEALDLDSDDVPDVLITGHVMPGPAVGTPAHVVRGIAPLPGTAFLMTNVRWGSWGPYLLSEVGTLTPEQLTAGLEGGTLRWASPENEPVFIDVLSHPQAIPGEPAQWSEAPFIATGDIVYRTTSYGQVYIGALEVLYTLPGGELGARPRVRVEEGHVLQLR